MLSQYSNSLHYKSDWSAVVADYPKIVLQGQAGLMQRSTFLKELLMRSRVPPQYPYSSLHCSEADISTSALFGLYVSVNSNWTRADSPVLIVPKRAAHTIDHIIPSVVINNFWKMWLNLEPDHKVLLFLGTSCRHLVVLSSQ